jgi:hypothetical protein
MLTLSCASTHSVVPGPEPSAEQTEEPVEQPASDAGLTPQAGDLMSSEVPAALALPMAPRLTGDGVFYVVGEDPKLPLARYSDGQIAMSNSCGIRLGNKLNRRIPPIYVNGQPVGFC